MRWFKLTGKIVGDTGIRAASISCGMEYYNPVLMIII